MADNHSKEVRSYNMSRIRSKNTKPEEAVGKYLFSKGLRYRKNVRSLAGKPDFVFPKYKSIVFVNGCFWHKHNCGRFHWPKSNVDYWRKKIERNVERDQINIQQLEAEGWKVIIVWECELKKDQRELRLESLYQQIVNGVGGMEKAKSVDLKEANSDV